MNAKSFQIFLFVNLKDLNQMDIQSLRYLVTLSETQNIRRAAALMRLTPPAISKAIRGLEEELGFPILARTGRNIVMTDRARALSERARKVIQDFESLRAQEEATQDHETIKIVTFEVFSTFFLESFGKIGWNDRRLVLHEAVPGELERAIQEGEADFGITYLPVPTAGLVFEKVLS
ncbi:MAG: LysR family transcriptional regulator, partial [Bdellovibrionota bacterium]